MPTDLSRPDDAEREYPHWNRVYLAVIIYTAALIVALGIFSDIFTP
jgi:hypothetical protein